MQRLVAHNERLKMAETDRELLEAAARAAGYTVFAWGRAPEWHPLRWKECLMIGPRKSFMEDQDQMPWNPLEDDGDALRLAVRLNIPVFPYDDETSTGTVGVVAKSWGSKEENTRRAIVRAAAAMAEQGGLASA